MDREDLRAPASCQQVFQGLLEAGAIEKIGQQEENSASLPRKGNFPARALQVRAASAIRIYRLHDVEEALQLPSPSRRPKQGTRHLGEDRQLDPVLVDEANVAQRGGDLL